MPQNAATIQCFSGCSSVGLEYLATNQGVVGSNPASRTILKRPALSVQAFFFGMESSASTHLSCKLLITIKSHATMHDFSGCSSVGLEYLATNQGVVGSNPASRTILKRPALSVQAFFFIFFIPVSAPHGGSLASVFVLSGKNQRGLRAPLTSLEVMSTISTMRR